MFNSTHLSTNEQGWITVFRIVADQRNPHMSQVMSNNQLKVVQINMRKVTDDRAMRLFILSGLTGRLITTTWQLTSGEASTFIDLMQNYDFQHTMEGLLHVGLIPFQE